MRARSRSHAEVPPPPTGADRELAATSSRGPLLRLAYGAVIAWIVGWFVLLLVQGICPVP